MNEAIAFETAPPGAEVERSVVSWYPESAEDILLSGWIRGREKLERRAAAVAFRVGRESWSRSAFASSTGRKPKGRSSCCSTPFTGPVSRPTIRPDSLWKRRYSRALQAIDS